MTKFTFALLLTAFASSGASAQGAAESVGVIQGVKGLVTVSQGNALGNVVKEEKILNGARVVTASTGSTIVKLYNGCVISLAPNQAVTIDSSLDCKSLIASIQSTGAGPVTAGAGGAVGVGGSSGLAAALVGGFGVAMILNSNSENSNPSQPSSGS